MSEQRDKNSRAKHSSKYKYDYIPRSTLPLAAALLLTPHKVLGYCPVTSRFAGQNPDFNQGGQEVVTALGPNYHDMTGAHPDIYLSQIGGIGADGDKWCAEVHWEFCSMADPSICETRSVGVGPDLGSKKINPGDVKTWNLSPDEQLTSGWLGYQDLEDGYQNGFFWSCEWTTSLGNTLTVGDTSQNQHSSYWGVPDSAYPDSRTSQNYIDEHSVIPTIFSFPGPIIAIDDAWTRAGSGYSDEFKLTPDANTFTGMTPVFDNCACASSQFQVGGLPASVPLSFDSAVTTLPFTVTNPITQTFPSQNCGAYTASVVDQATGLAVSWATTTSTEISIGPFAAGFGGGDFVLDLAITSTGFDQTALGGTIGTVPSTTVPLSVSITPCEPDNGAPSFLVAPTNYVYQLGAGPVTTVAQYFQASWGPSSCIYPQVVEISSCTGPTGDCLTAPILTLDTLQSQFTIDTSDPAHLGTYNVQVRIAWDISSSPAFFSFFGYLPEAVSNFDLIIQVCEVSSDPSWTVVPPALYDYYTLGSGAIATGGYYVENFGNNVNTCTYPLIEEISSCVGDQVPPVDCLATGIITLDPATNQVTMNSGDMTHAGIYTVTLRFGWDTSTASDYSTLYPASTPVLTTTFDVKMAPCEIPAGNWGFSVQPVDYSNYGQGYYMIGDGAVTTAAYYTDIHTDPNTCNYPQIESILTCTGPYDCVAEGIVTLDPVLNQLTINANLLQYVGLYTLTLKSGWDTAIAPSYLTMFGSLPEATSSSFTLEMQVPCELPQAVTFVTPPPNFVYTLGTGTLSATSPHYTENIGVDSNGCGYPVLETLNDCLGAGDCLPGGILTNFDANTNTFDVNTSDNNVVGDYTITITVGWDTGLLQSAYSVVYGNIPVLQNTFTLTIQYCQVDMPIFTVPPPDYKDTDDLLYRISLGSVTTASNYYSDNLVNPLGCPYPPIEEIQSCIGPVDCLALGTVTLDPAANQFTIFTSDEAHIGTYTLTLRIGWDTSLVPQFQSTFSYLPVLTDSFEILFVARCDAPLDLKKLSSSYVMTLEGIEHKTAPFQYFYQKSGAIFTLDHQFQVTPSDCPVTYSCLINNTPGAYSGIVDLCGGSDALGSSFVFNPFTAEYSFQTESYAKYPPTGEQTEQFYQIQITGTVGVDPYTIQKSVQIDLQTKQPSNCLQTELLIDTEVFENQLMLLHDPALTLDQPFSETHWDETIVTHEGDWELSDCGPLAFSFSSDHNNGAEDINEQLESRLFADKRSQNGNEFQVFQNHAASLARIYRITFSAELEYFLPTRRTIEFEIEVVDQCAQLNPSWCNDAGWEYDPVEAYVASINATSYVVIKFSEPMTPVTNMTLINNGTVTIDDQVLPAFELRMIYGINSDFTKLGFTWNCTNMTTQNLTCQLYYDYYDQVSIHHEQKEELVAVFQDDQLFRAKTGVPIVQGFVTEPYEIPLQEEPYRGWVYIAIEIYKGAAIGAFGTSIVMNLFVRGVLSLLLEALYTEQLLILILFVDTQPPTSTVMFMKAVNEVVAFDYFDVGLFYDGLFDLEPSEPVSADYEDRGFESVYFIHNMGTIFISLLTLPLGFILMACFSCSCCKRNRVTKWLGESIRRNLVFTAVIETIRANFGIMSLTTLMALQNLLWTNIGYSINSAVAISAAIGTVLTVIWWTVVLLMNRNQLGGEQFLRKYSLLVKNLKVDGSLKKSIVATMHVFFGRRILLAAIVLFLIGSNYLQIMLILSSNLAIISN